MMSSGKYIKAANENVEARLAKSDLRLPSKCDTPMSTSYQPSKDVTREINQSYQRVGSRFSIGRNSITNS